MFLAILGALAIGVSLGLTGSGGSILTVPILVYLVGQQEKAAIVGALLVVGCIAAVGAVHYTVRRLVHWQSVLWFGVPGMGGTWIGARLSAHVSGSVQLALFGAVMLVAAVLMLRPPHVPNDRPRREQAYWKIVLDGMLVGVLTGFVGVGGGFMIVPALVLLGGLPIHLAVGTSLSIITLNCFSGFANSLGVLDELGIELDWTILWTFVGVGVLGAVLGSHAGRHLRQATLRRVFAVLLLVAGVAILITTVFQLVQGDAAGVAG